MDDGGSDQGFPEGSLLCFFLKTPIFMFRMSFIGHHEAWSRREGGGRSRDLSFFRSLRSLSV